MNWAFVDASQGSPRQIELFPVFRKNNPNFCQPNCLGLTVKAELTPENTVSVCAMHCFGLCSYKRMCLIFLVVLSVLVDVEKTPRHKNFAAVISFHNALFSFSNFRVSREVTLADLRKVVSQINFKQVILDQSVVKTSEHRRPDLSALPFNSSGLTRAQLM